MVQSIQKPSRGNVPLVRRCHRPIVFGRVVRQPRPPAMMLPIIETILMTCRGRVDWELAMKMESG
jgi:hypothetical protein